MDKKVLETHINELEVAIDETDKLMQEAFEASVFMVEPIRTQFVDKLILKRLELDERKNDLKFFKEIVGV